MALPLKFAVLKLSMISSAFSIAYCFFVDRVFIFIAEINCVVRGTINIANTATATITSIKLKPLLFFFAILLFTPFNSNLRVASFYKKLLCIICSSRCLSSYSRITKDIIFTGLNVYVNLVSCSVPTIYSI